MARRGASKDDKLPDYDETELHPDAWERFEKAFDTVMKAPRKPPTKSPREPSPAHGGKRGGKGPA